MKENLKIGVSGVRGIVGNGLIPSVVREFSYAFGIYAGEGMVIIGRDTRESGKDFFPIVASGLQNAKCDVVDLGIALTPTLQIMVEMLKANGGIAITASHNPIEWNGLKFISKEGIFLSESEWRELLNIKKRRTDSFIDKGNLQRIKKYYTGGERHIEKILSLPYISIEKIKKRKLKVAVDCVNGAGGRIFPLLFKKFGCEVFSIGCEMDGKFNRNPEPISENILELCKLVKRVKADVGFAVDPDGDRLAIVSEEGIAIGEEYTLGLAGLFILQKKMGTVVVNISTSRMIEDLSLKFNSKVVRTKVGEANVVEEMRRRKAIFGGEGNGGVILPDIHYGRDALVGASLVIALLSESKHKISELVREIGDYYIVKKKFEVNGVDDFLQKIKKIYNRCETDEKDGLKIIWKDRWINIRKSRTEPVVRVIAEAKMKSEAEALVGEIIDLLNSK